MRLMVRGPSTIELLVIGTWKVCSMQAAWARMVVPQAGNVRVPLAAV